VSLELGLFLPLWSWSGLFSVTGVGSIASLELGLFSVAGAGMGSIVSLELGFFFWRCWNWNGSYSVAGFGVV
jgi:hypothetical protein